VYGCCVNRSSWRGVRLWYVICYLLGLFSSSSSVICSLAYTRCVFSQQSTDMSVTVVVALVLLLLLFLLKVCYVPLHPSDQSLRCSGSSGLLARPPTWTAVAFPKLLLLHTIPRIVR
jgi:hypothetical protein